MSTSGTLELAAVLTEAVLVEIADDVVPADDGPGRAGVVMTILIESAVVVTETDADTVGFASNSERKFLH